MTATPIAADPYEAELNKLVADMYADPLGFVMAAWPWGVPDGPLAAAKGPDRLQRRFLEDLGKHIRERKFDGSTPVMPIRMAISSCHGAGKAQPKSLVVDTPAGPRKWGDIRPGDLVFGASGAPVAVVACHEQGVREIYRIIFDDGSSTLCDGEHLWTVNGRSGRRKHGGGGWETLSTCELLDRGVVFPNGVAYGRNWKLPIQGPAEFPEKPLPVHPYFMGVWLGDGTKGEPQYTKPFPEIAERLQAIGYEVSTTVQGTRNRILGLAERFTDPVFSLGSHERYVPEEYLYTSAENRRELLRGLLDTDGECAKNRCGVSYSSTSETLARNVIWLVRSLGGKATMQPTPKQGWYPDADGERKICRLCYRVTIQLDWNPFTLKHRAERWKSCEHRYLTRWIDAIEPAGAEESMCITVDAADGLYLTNDFIVTHNSTLGAWLACWILSTRPYSIGTATAGTYDQLERVTWAEIMHWMRLCVTGHWFDIQASGIYAKDPKLAEKWKITPKTAAADRAQTFAGQHSRTSTSFFLFDEASEIADKVFETAYGGLTDGEPMFFAWGQMIRNSGEFYNVCFGDASNKRWDSRVWDGRESGLTNKAYIEEIKQDWGEESDYWRVRVLGMPPRASELQFIGQELIDGARKRDHKPLADEPLVWGFDAANGGQARFCLWARRGLDAASIPPIFMPGDTPRDVVVGKIIEIMSDRREGRRAAALFGDQAFGAVILQRVRDMGYTNVFEVNFGDTSHDKHYLNRRAEMWGRMKEWLNLGSIIDDPKYYQSLMDPGFGHRNGKLVLESKADMARRGVKSPDSGDSLALTFAQAVAMPPAPAKAPPPRQVSRYSYMG